MISILHLEDDPRDAELIQYELSKLEATVRVRRVYNREQYVRELETAIPDLILADHRVPSLEQGEALRLAQELAPGVPFILITGTLDDEMAVSYLKTGAVNYILKDHIARLRPAVASALLEAERERQLRWQRSLLREVLSAAPSLITCEDAAGRVLLANAAAAEALDVALEELLEGSPATLALPASEVGERARRRREVLETGRSSFAAEEPITSQASGTRWYQVVRKPLRLDGRSDPLVLTVATDISERKRIFEAMPDAVLLVAPDGRVVRANDAAERLFGRSETELVGRTPTELLPGLDLAAGPADAMARGFAGEPVVTAHDGREVHVDIQVAEVALDEGRHRVLVLRDVTARRDLERQLLAASRLESVGRLAGGVAHDFNNLLMVILAQGELLLTRDDLAPGVRDSLGEIIDAARRGGGLTRQLLAFSRRQVLQPRLLDLNATVAGMETLLRRVLGEDIEVRSRLADEVGTVCADPGQLEQVMLNLAVNARDAMPSGGCLSLETADVTIDAAECDAVKPMPSGRYVLLAVTDDGQGMDEETRANAFEPFFTTKGEAGTGLGLATVYGVVKQSGGFVWIDSAPGAGTRVEIYLPACVDAVAGPASPRPEDAPARGGRETILLVEDEERLRRPVRKSLERLGYTVLDAGSSQEAMAIAADAGRIDLLFTDVVLPDGSGPTLASGLRGTHPEMAVLFTSGYAGEALTDRGTLELEMHFLQKPYSVATLASHIRQALDAAIGTAER